MGYVVPDWKKSIKQNMYDITIGKKVFEIPHAKYLTGEQAERFQNDGGDWELFDELAKGLGAELKKLPIFIVEDIIEDWQKESGISVGESVPSETK